MKKHILLISALFAIVTLLSCGKIKGEGDNVEVKPSVSEFTSLDIAIPATIIITQGSKSELKMSIQDNVYKNTDIYVKDGELNIEFDKQVRKHKPITILITMNDLDDLDFSGSCNVKIADEFNECKDVSVSTSGGCEVEIVNIACKNFSYDASGSSNLWVNYIEVEKSADIETSGGAEVAIDYIKADKIAVESSGSAEMELSGEAKSQDLESSGGMNYNAINLQTTKTKIKTSGNGNYEVAVSSLLNIDASGSTTIKYAGSPDLELKQSGSFSLSEIK